MNSKNKNSKITKRLIWTFVILSLIGILDASYLTLAHYQNASLFCLSGQSCDKVTASVYSTVGQIPVSLLGLFYYGAVFCLSMVYLWYLKKQESKEKSSDDIFANLVINFLPRITVLGFLASLWFVYLQLFVIKEICTYCMVSAITSTALFTLGLAIINKQRSEMSEAPVEIQK